MSLDCLVQSIARNPASPQARDFKFGDYLKRRISVEQIHVASPDIVFTGQDCVENLPLAA
jgi:hypothetical protein